MLRTELLAPAKDKTTAIAAIDCGADAVYIGASAFGARKNVPNSLEDIKEVVNYAHKFWAKVFVTVNTILTDDELKNAIELIKNLDKIGVDAIIVQDLGLLNELKKEKLSIPIHMSTQCDNREIEKVSFFNKVGVSRVVLARELSLEKIKAIYDANPNLELEAFVHGALCVSYSGQCYLSQYIGGRSANRGECAQPCRKKYSILNDKGDLIKKDIYALCLKDFNASKHLEQMAKSGVFSFKIEGRLKDTSYVKNVTAFYRQELDKFSKKISSGKSFYQFEPNPEKSFNRNFTDYFLETRKDCFNFNSPKSKGEFIGTVTEIKKDFFVIASKKEIHPQDGLTYANEGFLVNKVDKDKIYPNKKIDLKIGTKLFRNSDFEFEKKLLQPTKRQIGVSVEVKTNKIYLIDEDNIQIEIEINSTETAKNTTKMNETFCKQFSKMGESDFYLEKLNLVDNIPFLPISEINELRRASLDKLMQKRLDSYKREKQKELKYTAYYKDKVDYRANIHNKSAIDFYKECNCDVLENSMESFGPTRTIELMRTKHCIKYALNKCKSKENLFLQDEFGKIFPLKFDCKNCEMIVLSSNQ